MDQSPKKFKVVTLGCRTNQYESQAYADQLKQLGYETAGENETADICIVNTCTVTASADNQSLYEIRQLAAKNPGSKLVVTGCASEQQPERILKIGGVSAVVANKDKESLLSAIFPDLDIPEFAITDFECHTRAFVKVQDGCNSFCTYCIIPYVRGRSRSRTIAEVVEEVKGLVANGFKEVVITGINVGDFDGAKPEGEKPDTLADLMRAVDNIEGLKRLRLSSIDPDEITDDLLDIIVNGKTTCQSMHIVLQAGSNVILKRMNRKYTRQIFLESVDRLKAASPTFSFTTDVIVGFPGETEADFNETLAVIHEVQFAKVHMFPYSERQRTRAALMPNKVPPQIIKERKQIVLRASEQSAFALQSRFVGQRMLVLTESADEDLIYGHTDNFLKVFMPKDNWESNQILEVELVENTAKGLRGVVIGRCND